MRPSTSRFSTSSEAEIRLAPAASVAFALSIDVEEWYHTCWVEEWIDPGRRPALREELDSLLPSCLELLERASARATFFVLGEVARRLPMRIRELVAAGHEVASHGSLHHRVDYWTLPELARQVREEKDRLEDLTGSPVLGYRAPEWSMRFPGNPRLRSLAGAGFAYDSSVSPSPGAGRRSNPVLPYELCWSASERLFELPPLTFAGQARLPACGWTGRVVPPSWIAGAARDLARRGGVPVMTFHPWEIVDRSPPGEMMGFARFFHDAGRRGFGAKLAELLQELNWVPISAAIEMAGVGTRGNETSRNPGSEPRPRS